MVYFRYILENFSMIFELIGLLILLGISAHISERMKKLTFYVLLLLLAESIFFYMEQWTQTFRQLSPLRPLLTACVYSLYPVILLLVMQIMVSKKISRRSLLLLLIPEAVSVPLYFTSQWTHLICWFSSDNSYHRGPLYFWPYLIFGFYSLVFLIQNLRYFSSYTGKDRLTAVYIIIGPLVGVVYYRIFSENKDYSALMCSAILLYYIFVYIHMAKIDPLTALLNRQSYYHDMELRAKTITGVVSVDMNELKYINDNLGHQAGDDALQTIADILRDNCGRGASVYRVGGDEFVILYSGAGEAQLTEAIAAMRQKLSETSYTCAFGHAMVQPGGSINDAVVEADGRMYADKAAIKAAQLARGEVLHGRAP